MTTIRIGTSLRSSYPFPMVDGDVRTVARWMIERAAAARAAGLDSLFVGDHHVTGPHPYFQNSAIMGRLLAEWGDAPAGALYLLPLWNPVLVAEQLGTLAAIAKGRFILQCALGGGDDQFAGMGVPLKRRVSLFEHHLSVIRRLLAGEAVPADEADDRYGQAAFGRGAFSESVAPVGGAASSGTGTGSVGGADVDVRIAPLPPEPIEIWIGGHAPAALDRAARLGDAWMAGPEATDADAEALVAGYRSACARHGRTPSAVALRRDIHVGVDAADAARVAGPVIERGYRGFDTSACVVGGPEEVAARFESYARLGFTDIIVRHLVDEQSEVLASIARLAEVRKLLGA